MKTAKSIKGHCDRIFSRIVRERAGNQCQKCGSRDNVQCAHILSRSWAMTRCYKNNALALCASCHSLFGMDPPGFTEFVVGVIGAEEVAYIRELANSGGKVDWSETLEDLKQEAKRMGVSTA